MQTQDPQTHNPYLWLYSGAGGFDASYTAPPLWSVVYEYSPGNVSSILVGSTTEPGGLSMVYPVDLGGLYGTHGNPGGQTLHLRVSLNVSTVYEAVNYTRDEDGVYRGRPMTVGELAGYMLEKGQPVLSLGDAFLLPQPVPYYNLTDVVEKPWRYNRLEYVGVDVGWYVKRLVKYLLEGTGEG
ncbi:MAG: hypothetical protein F7B18_06880, partial [Desulfurococcales archaeon]|nr:hypothetical protein [Desulfurococcales archaeon]